MLMHENPYTYTDDLAVLDGAENMIKAALHHTLGDGYRCLETVGDDLSLEDALLVDMDDFLAS